MNVEGVVLKLLLLEEATDSSLTQFSKLKTQYFSQSFSSLYKHIEQFYSKYGKVPSLGELATLKSRSASVTSALMSLEAIDVDGIELELAIEALIDQFAQNKALDLIDSLLKDIALLDRNEIVDVVGAMPMKLEDSLETTEKVYTPKAFRAFHQKEELDAECVKIGISNQWDTTIGGFYRQDLLLIGGKRGDGKSITCANLAAAQYKMGNSVMYFTIEMTQQETFNRILAILSGVDYEHIKKGELTLDEQRTIGKTRADMFVDGMDVYSKYFDDNLEPDTMAFEEELTSTCREQDHKIIIVDDRDLSMSSIDVQVTKARSSVGDGLSMVIVDYLNQIRLDGVSESDMYDWKPQITISKSLKNQARKHNVVVVSPFQMEESGGVRFSKGIEDACDVTLKLHNNKDLGILELSTAKARASDDSLVVGMDIDWKCLKIDPREVNIDDLQQQKDEETQQEHAMSNPPLEGAREL